MVLVAFNTFHFLKMVSLGFIRSRNFLRKNITRFRNDLTLFTTSLMKIERNENGERYKQWIRKNMNGIFQKNKENGAHEDIGRYARIVPTTMEKKDCMTSAFRGKRIQRHCLKCVFLFLADIMLWYHISLRHGWYENKAAILLTPTLKKTIIVSISFSQVFTDFFFHLNFGING